MTGHSNSRPYVLKVVATQLVLIQHRISAAVFLTWIAAFEQSLIIESTIGLIEKHLQASVLYVTQPMTEGGECLVATQIAGKSS